MPSDEQIEKAIAAAKSALVIDVGETMNDTVRIVVEAAAGVFSEQEARDEVCPGCNLPASKGHWDNCAIHPSGPFSQPGQSAPSVTGDGEKGCPDCENGRRLDLFGEPTSDPCPTCFRASVGDGEGEARVIPADSVTATVADMVIEAMTSYDEDPEWVRARIRTRANRVADEIVAYIEVESRASSSGDGITVQQKHAEAGLLSEVTEIIEGPGLAVDRAESVIEVVLKRVSPPADGQSSPVPPEGGEGK